MVVKASSKFQLPKFFLFNAAAAVVGVATLTWIVRDAMYPETTATCGVRYQQAMMFNLTRGGQPMSAAELQARLAGRDWGVLENTSVIAVDQGPAALALKVSLPKGGANASRTSQSSGMGFNWTPGQLSGAKSACLTYNVFLPKDFDFGSGGALPGIYGEAAGAKSDAAAFSVRGRWRDGGSLELRTGTAGNPDGNSLVSNDRSQEPIARGRWVRVDQEVVLNTPGAKDGIIWLWMDDQLKLEAKALNIRDKAAGFAGITADTHYSRGDLAWAPSPKDASVLLSPFELRWQ